MEIWSLCGQCHHFQYTSLFAYCDKGCVKEFREDGGLTLCDFWESKRKKLLGEKK